MFQCVYVNNSESIIWGKYSDHYIYILCSVEPLMIKPNQNQNVCSHKIQSVKANVRTESNAVIMEFNNIHFQRSRSHTQR